MFRSVLGAQTIYFDDQEALALKRTLIYES
jgi:hypothetical protein